MQEKDERNEEYKWEVHPGMILRTMLWAEPMRGQKTDKFKEDLIAAGHAVIKAFTLMEIELTCKVCLIDACQLQIVHII